MQKLLTFRKYLSEHDLTNIEFNLMFIKAFKGHLKSVSGLTY